MVGLFVQFLLGIIVLRWQTGFRYFDFIFREIFRFFLYSMSGAAVVYGDPFFLFHPIALYVSSLMIYLGCCAAIIYNIVRVIRLVRWFKRLIPHSTDSQLHMFLVSTHALFSGFALSFMSISGVPVRHMITGMTLCVPCAFAIALINFPDTQKSTFSRERQRVKDQQGRKETNIFIIGFKGALLTARTMWLTLAHTLAFIGLYAFLDSVFAWMAGRIGLRANIMDTIGYAFMPVAYMMGVRWEDCYLVGCLISDKVFGLALRAFLNLGYLISSNALQGDTVAITTQALLGFSVFGTLGTWIGLFRTVGPRHLPRMLSILPRLMFNANIICFYTASVAVVLSPDSAYEEGREPGDPNQRLLLLWLLRSLPSYRDLIGLVQ